MEKGVSIPINTLVMLAVAIIVLLAAVAWFMGAFGPTAQQQTLQQNFNSKCQSWALSNCDNCTIGTAGCVESTDSLGMPDNVAKAYHNMTGVGYVPDTSIDTRYEVVAEACNCLKPFGRDFTY